MSEQRQALPVGLASMAPGPELGVLLSTVDRARVGSAELFDLIAARARQVAHDQAQLLADVYEAGRAAHATEYSLTRAEVPDEFAANQVAWTLSWSRSYAQQQLQLGQELTRRLPMVWSALAAGRLDQAKAAAFVYALAELDDDTARAIANRLLDRAQRWTLTQVRDRLRYHAHKADPTLATRSYLRAVSDRQVWLQPYTDGTAMLAGANLAPHRAAAAFDHVDRIARAAKAAGDPRTLPQLRADAYVALLTGNVFRRQPPTDPLTQQADTTAAGHGTVRDDPHDLAGHSPIGQPRHRRPRMGKSHTTSRRTRDASDTDRPNNAGRGKAGRGKAGRAEAGRGEADEPPDDIHADDEPIGRATFEPPEDTDPDHGREPDHDRDPDRHAGRDPDQSADPDPSTMDNHDDGGATGRCSCGDIVQPGQRRGVVDIQVRLDTLMGLNDHPALLDGWGPVIADIARQVAYDQHTNPAWRWSVTDANGDLLHHGHTGRRPDATEKAFVKARDRTCRAPGCTRRAIHCDDDHTILAAHGGPAHRGNLCCLCQHHHRLRHERGYRHTWINHANRWWTTPNGRHYLTTADDDLRLTADHPQPPDPYTLYYALPPDPEDAMHGQRPIDSYQPTGDPHPCDDDYPTDEDLAELDRMQRMAAGTL